MEEKDICRRKASGIDISWGIKSNPGMTGAQGPCKLSAPPLPGDRERRYGQIRNYMGRASELLELTRRGELTSQSRIMCEIGACPILYILLDASLIARTVPIIHGPVGCQMNNKMLAIGFEGLGFFFPKEYRPDIDRPIKRLLPMISISTCQNEDDVIFGSEDKLRDAIIEVDRRFKPAIIPVCSTCASSIIGDDIAKVVDEVKDKVDAYVYAMNSEGVCNIWENGRNTFWHGLVYGFMEEPKKKIPNRINYITNYTGIQGGGVEVIRQWCKKLGVEINTMPFYATPESIKTAPESIATVGICESAGYPVGEYMLDRFNVPFLHLPQPLGVKYLRQFMYEIAKLVGKEKQFEELFECEVEKYIPELEEIRRRLKGKKAVLAVGGGRAVQFAQVLREVGVETVVLGFYYYNRAFSAEVLADYYEQEKAEGRDPLVIVNPQMFEIFKAGYQTGADFYFTDYCTYPRMNYLPNVRGMIMFRYNKVQWQFLKPYMFGIEGVVNFGKELLRRLHSNYHDIFRPYQNLTHISARWYADDTIPLGIYMEKKENIRKK